MNIITEPKPKCPDCYEGMVLRTRRSDQRKFWGCSNWPDCEGSRSIKPDGTPVSNDDLFNADDYGWWADADDPGLDW